MDLNHIDHIGIIVDSAEESMDFYTEVLGLKFKGRAESEVTGDSYYHLVLERDDNLDSHLELVEVSDESPLAEAKMDEKGISHIAYRVENAESAVRELKNTGCEVVLEPTVIGDIIFAYLKPADQYIFEVVEMPKKYDNSVEVPPPE